ncbi:DNA repair protein RecO [Paenactinomyces guangxiensis]|uniref:DNA repair protein RecO n=1 Tax=Paenactinomyces guangxiensis TaxID=1490290 RepID=A0A7W1WNI1_9BACL|nr:DNA repair protein RecO [Paenactinomyces guangxiensis]MBA4493163.1 DNA repair protein RecO [Paenactinomyces guangxiensis]MBH8589987.1 DNA repair protein RecO [Paenactinomyces guangxiensis]
MLHKVEGIVLKAKDYGESHQIVLIFTEYQGKIAVMARGSKKTKSRFGAVTEPFTQAHFVWFSGGSGMGTLSQADLIHSRRLIRSDLLLTAYGAYWLDLIDKCTEEKEPNPPLYRFLASALDKLENGTDPDILTRIVELRVMGVSGVQPVLHHCVNCRSNRRPVSFSVSQGGFLCADCQSVDRDAFPISEASARILPLLSRIELDRLGEIKVKPETKEQLERMNHAFMDEYLPFHLKSREILNQIRQNWV